MKDLPPLFRLLLLLLCLNPCSLIGQDSTLTRRLVELRTKLGLAKYKNEDAVMLIQDRSVLNHFMVLPQYTSNYDPYLSNFRRSGYDLSIKEMKGSVEVVYQRIKILTQKGAEDYSRIYIPKSTVGKIANISAKTIKPDGTILTLKKEDIKEVESVNNGLYSWKQQHYRFSVPGVEAGDELEIVYVISKPGDLTRSGDYFFSTHLPTLQSSLKLIFSNSIVVSVKNYNGLKAPEHHIQGGSYQFEYARYDLAALRDIDHAILYNEMPYCKYQILSVSTPFSGPTDAIKVAASNWTDFSQGFIIHRNQEEVKETKARFLKQFVLKYYPVGSRSPHEAFRKMIRVIADSMTLENTSSKPEYTSGYYLFRRSIPPSALNRIYTDLLDELGINYYYCFGASKSRGKIDTTLVSIDDFSSLFFAYHDEKDSLRYLFPENNLLQLTSEEINPYHFGSFMLLISVKDPGKHMFGKLPDFPSSFNVKKRKNRVHVDFDANLLRYEALTTKPGAFSYFERAHTNRFSKDSLNSDVIAYFKNELKNFTIDTSYYTGPDSLFPYKYCFNYRGHQKNRLLKVADSLWSIDLSEWIDHSVLPVYSTDRFVDYYPDFRYQEQFNYFYVFKTPVEVQNPGSLAGGLTNEFGSYQFSINQISDTIVQVQSVYKILKDRLPGYEFSKLKQLNDQWSLYKNAAFLVRIKPSSVHLSPTN